MSTMSIIKAAITRFDKVAQELAFVGSQDPEDRPLIREEHEQARMALERMIQRHLK